MAKKPKKDDQTKVEANTAPEIENVVEHASDEVETLSAETQDTIDEVVTDANDDDMAEVEDAEVLSTGAEDDTIAEQSAQSDATTAAPEVIKETIVENRAGFIPTLLGGVIAGGIGFLVAQQMYTSDAADLTADLQKTIVEQTQRIDDLSAKLDATPVLPEVDLSGVEASVSDAEAQIGALADQIGAIEGRVTEIASRPVPDTSGEVTVDLSGVQSQIDELRVALDLQKGTLAQMIEAAQAEQASAEDAVRTTAARAALTRVLVALENGAPFEDALADIQANSDVAIPEALAQVAATGAPSVTDLSSSYPAAAREALAAARSETPAGGLGSFLTRQLGARSVTPQEGDDPDAVLSRMEAAVRDGRIADALTEFETLPDAAKAPLAEWAAQANLRLTAASEADALATSLNSQ